MTPHARTTSRLKHARVTVGADDEFVLFDPRARDIVRAFEAFDDESRTGLVGVDATEDVAELRPNPTTCPIDLARNTKDAVERLSRLLEQDKLRGVVAHAGSHRHGYSLGGHIHFGNAPAPAHELLTTLHLCLAVPVLMVERADAARARRTIHAYGRLDDGDTYRGNSHGWEYRVLPSLLSDPEVYVGVHATAYTILDHAARCAADDTPYPGPNPTVDGDFMDRFHEADVKAIAPLLAIARKHVRSLPMYSTYAPFIERFYARAEHHAALNTGDIVAAWRAYSAANDTPMPDLAAHPRHQPFQTYRVTDA